MKQISLIEATATEAMAQIDAMTGLNAKNRNCLRLLTEEMFSMVNELLKAEKPDFGIACEEERYTLRLSVKTRVNEEARKQFLAMSTDGRNTAGKGIKGKLHAIMEAFLYADEYNEGTAAWRYGMTSIGSENSHVWSLSQYIDYAPPEVTRNDWDGMEKSIIANFADDITIGVRSGMLDMTVTKAFA